MISVGASAPSRWYHVATAVHIVTSPRAPPQETEPITVRPRCRSGQLHRRSPAGCVACGRHAPAVLVRLRNSLFSTELSRWNSMRTRTCAATAACKCSAGSEPAPAIAASVVATRRPIVSSTRRSEGHPWTLPHSGRRESTAAPGGCPCSRAERL